MIVVKFENSGVEMISIEDACRFSNWCSMYYQKMSDKFDDGDVWVDMTLGRTRYVKTDELFKIYRKEYENKGMV